MHFLNISSFRNLEEFANFYDVSISVSIHRFHDQISVLRQIDNKLYFQLIKNLLHFLKFIPDILCHISQRIISIPFPFINF